MTSEYYFDFMRLGLCFFLIRVERDCNCILQLNQTTIRTTTKAIKTTLLDDALKGV